ncbi:MAG: NAD-dependent epimerase/dehydratase family protein [Bacteroidales bacterium]
MQTILGAGGAIGKILARELPRYTCKIRLVSRNPQKVNSTDEIIAANLFEPGVIDRVVSNSEVVYLVVGLEYKLKVWQERWPVMIRELIEACSINRTRLVFFDNVYAYSRDSIPHMTEDSPMDPPSRKGVVRREIALMLLEAMKEKKVAALIARAADFYGPGNRNSIVNELVVKNLAAGRRAMWFMDKSKKHSLTYTPDAARATAILGNTPGAFGKVWHLPTDSNTLTGAELIRMFANELKVKDRSMVMPMWMIKASGLVMPVMKEMPEMMYQYEDDYIFNSSRFEDQFGMKPTPYADGIRETCSEFLINRG